MKRLVLPAAVLGILVSTNAPCTESTEKISPQQAEPLLREMTNPEPAARLRAIRRLRDLHVDANYFLPMLVRRINDEYPLVARAACDELRRIGPDTNSALPRLKPLLRHSMLAGDAFAALAFGSEKEALALVELGKEHEAEKPKNPPRRGLIVKITVGPGVYRALGKLGVASPDVLEFLVQRSSKDQGALEALAELAMTSAEAKVAVLELIRQRNAGIYELAETAMNGKGQAKQDAIAELAKSLQKQDASIDPLLVLRMAAPAVPEIVVPACLEFTRKHNVWALRLLESYGPHAAAAAPTLASLLASGGLSVEGPLVAIGAPAVEELLKPEYWTTDEQCLLNGLVLEQMPKEVASLLPQRLEDGQVRETQIVALRAAASCGPAVGLCIPRMIELLNNSDKEIQVTAIKALGAARPVPITAIPQLRTLMRAKDAIVRVAAVRALAEVASGMDDSPERTTTISQMAAVLRDSDQEVVFATVEALGTCGDLARRSLPELRKLLREAKGEKATVVADAMRRINLQEAISAIPPDPRSKWKVAKVPQKPQEVLAIELDFTSPGDVNTSVRSSGGGGAPRVTNPLFDDIGEKHSVTTTYTVVDHSERFFLGSSSGERKLECLGYYMLDDQKRQNTRVLLFAWPADEDGNWLNAAEIKSQLYLVDTCGSFSRPSTSAKSKVGLPAFSTSAPAK